MIGTKMATTKLPSQEKKDLDKFMKFFTLKAAQIIVQSRLGEKVHTKCDPDSSGTVWVSKNVFFNGFLYKNLVCNFFIYISP